MKTKIYVVYKGIWEESETVIAYYEKELAEAHVQKLKKENKNKSGFYAGIDEIFLI